MLAWLQLLRIALAPSVIWDAVAGSLLGWGIAEAAGAELAFPASELAATIGILLAIFHGGMAWNDWVDRKIDLAAGRRRPLVDGRLSPTAGFVAGAVLFGLAIALCAAFLPSRLDLVLILVGLVAVYDLGGKSLRAVAGPVLLALCRMMSLSLGMLVVLEPSDLVRTAAMWMVLAYGLYLLFLSRLAAREEEGLHGTRAVVPVAACAFAPVVLTHAAERLWLLIPAWILFAVWLVRPALADRMIEWSPERVQAAVRRCLMGMPMIPAMALLAGPGAAPAAIGGLAAVGVTRILVRRFPPE